MYMSVLGTPTAYSYCCSFNCKINTNRIFLFSIIAWALDTGELLGSSLDRFIALEEV